MKTKLLDKNKINEAAKIIREGGLVAFPTETVYGLGANGLNPQAVEKIFKVKKRPVDNPLILHISSIEDIYPLVTYIPEKSIILMERFWPGPLTLLFNRSQLVPDIITGGLDTVAIRMPDNPLALELIRASKVPLAGPSANISGRPSPTKTKHVIEDLDGKIEGILDGGETQVGIESTVLDMTSEIPTILRPGKITIEDLKEFIPDVIEDPGLNNNEVKSPGQKYKHYAPKADLIIYDGDIENIINKIIKEAESYIKKGINIGIMATEESKKHYDYPNILVVGSRQDKNTIAHNLFNVLRQFDELNVDIILGEGIDQSQVGTAIMNRLVKASGGNIIRV